MSLMLRYLPILVLLTGCSDSGSVTDSHSSQNEDQRYEMQLNKFDEQAARADAQLDLADRQAARFEAVLKKWEEQAARYDALLTEWERQAKAGRK